MTTSPEWRQRHAWRLDGPPVHLVRRDRAWYCMIASIEVRARFESAGVPHVALSGGARDGYGPFRSISDATAVAASICGCEPRRRQGREYWLEGCPLVVRSVVGSYEWFSMAPDAPAVYTIARDFDSSDAERFSSAAPSSRTASSTRRLRVVRRHWTGRYGERYSTLAEAQGAVERFARHHGMLGSDADLLRRQARLSLDRWASRSR